MAAKMAITNGRNRKTIFSAVDTKRDVVMGLPAFVLKSFEVSRRRRIKPFIRDIHVLAWMLIEGHICFYLNLTLNLNRIEHQNLD